MTDTNEEKGQLELAQLTAHLLESLTARESKILRMRRGVGMPKTHTLKEISKQFDISPQRVSQIEKSALRKLRHPSIHRRLIELSEKYQTEISPPIELRQVVESAQSLSIDLIWHLKSHKEDINKIPWNVFEHLVAEFLKFKGFVDVRLVGRDSSTSADIYAMHLDTPLNTKIRFFVEVKRGKDKVGIGVINGLFGAINLEKEAHGWHAGIIVSVSDFKEFKKHSQAELQLKGIEMKNREDLFMWLDEYEPNKDGLWLPKPIMKMPAL